MSQQGKDDQESFATTTRIVDEIESRLDEISYCYHAYEIAGKKCIQDVQRYAWSDTVGNWTGPSLYQLNEWFIEDIKIVQNGIMLNDYGLKFKSAYDRLMKLHEDYDEQTGEADQAVDSPPFRVLLEELLRAALDYRRMPDELWDVYQTVRREVRQSKDDEETTGGRV